MSVQLVAIGFAVGILVGLTGVGGGSIMTPLLVLIGVNPLVAVGVDLLYSVPTKLIGALVHWKQRTVNAAIVTALLLGGFPASCVGMAALFWLRAHVDLALLTSWTKHAIGVVLFISAAIILIRPILSKAVSRGLGSFAWSKSQRRRTIAIGALVGLIVTMTSIGSGSVTLPLLSLALPIAELEELIGSDVAFAAFLIPTAAVGRWAMGDVNLPLVANLLTGSIPGVYLGSRLCGIMRQQWLRPAVALTLVFVGIRLI